MYTRSKSIEFWEDFLVNISHIPLENMCEISSVVLVFLTLVVCPSVDNKSINKLTSKYSNEKIVLISFDGFRHDFVKRENLQNFSLFQNEGVVADKLEPVFITKTFPNHVTMVTGLYEESHGIISNHMFDPVYNETFHPSKSSDSKWWNMSTPIWILNEQHVNKRTNKTKKRKSATIYWPGSEAAYNGKYPSFTYKDYRSAKNKTARHRLSEIVQMMSNDNDLNFVACYIDDIDRAAHEYGPDSQETKDALQKIDEDFGYFIQAMQYAKLYDTVNIIVVSDHGFATVKPENVKYLEDYLKDESDYNLDNYGSFLLLRPTSEEKKVKVYEALKNVSNLGVYYKEDIPEHWHYKNNRRVPDIFAIADEGFYFAPKRNDSSGKPTWLPHGDHGYDNSLSSMHGIFMARGPVFKKNLKTGTIKNIDLCELMCHILNLPSHPNNGSLKNVYGILREKSIYTEIMKKPEFIIALLSICGIFLFIVILGCTVSCFRNFVTSSRYKRVHEENMPLSEWHDNDDDDDEVTEYKFGER